MRKQDIIASAAKSAPLPPSISSVVDVGLYRPYNNAAAIITVNKPTYDGKLPISQYRINTVPTTSTIIQSTNVSRTNLIKNPSFETNADLWIGGGTAATILTRTTAVSYTGSASLALSPTFAGNLRAYYYGSNSSTPLTNTVPVTPGNIYTFSGYGRAATTPRAFDLLIDWYDAAGNLVTSYETGDIFDTTTSWTRQTMVVTAPAGAAYALPSLRFQGAALTEVHYIDSVIFEEWSGELPYFDGSVLDNSSGRYTGTSTAWTGLAHASTSTMTGSDYNGPYYISFPGLTSAASYTFTATVANATGTGLPSSGSFISSVTSVPQAPSGLSLSNVVGITYVNNPNLSLNFSIPATGGKSITSYQYSTDSGVTYATPASNPSPTVFVLTTQSNGSAFVKGSSYSVVLRAGNDNWYSLNSAVSNSATASTAPETPTIGTATRVNNTTATVTWTPNNNGGSPLTSVTVESSPSITLSYTVTDLDGSINVTGSFVLNTSYSFRVRTTNANGISDFSAFSNSVIVNPSVVPNFATPNFPNFPNFATPNFPNFPNFATPNFPNFPNFATPNFPNFPNFASPNFPNFATPNFPNFPNFASPNFPNFATPNFPNSPTLRHRTSRTLHRNHLQHVQHTMSKFSVALVQDVTADHNSAPAVEAVLVDLIDVIIQMDVTKIYNLHKKSMSGIIIKKEKYVNR